MSKIAKSMAILGVVAGLGVAALPLSSYAAEGSVRSGDVTVRVTVDSSLAVASSESDINLGTINSGTPVREGTTNVTVSGSSQLNWQLSIEDKDANNALTLTDADGAILSGAADGTQKISAGAPAKGTSNWGFMGGTVTSFEAVPVAGAGTVFATGTFGADASAENLGTDTTTVTFGVSAGPGLEDGVYKDTVVFIAAPKA